MWVKWGDQILTPGLLMSTNSYTASKIQLSKQSDLPQDVVIPVVLDSLEIQHNTKLKKTKQNGIKQKDMMKTLVVICQGQQSVPCKRDEILKFLLVHRHIICV